MTCPLSLLRPHPIVTSSSSVLATSITNINQLTDDMPPFFTNHVTPHPVVLFSPSASATSITNNNNNSKFTERFQRLNSLYNLIKGKTRKYPYTKSMLYKQMENTKMNKHFHTNPGKIHAHTWTIHILKTCPLGLQWPHPTVLFSWYPS